MVLSKYGVAICTLNQFALDFEGNLERILRSIDRAVELGATVRVGPELEVTGYGCEDAFYEADTVHHSWQVLAKILERGYKDILITIGMPVVKDSALYNCLVVVLNSKIVLVRPKNRLAVNGNYRENRWFSAWGDGTSPSLTWLQLPSLIRQISGQRRAPFGDGAILEVVNSAASPLLLETDLACTNSAIRIGFEICEELWQADTASSRLLGLRGVHLVINVSGSYWELRKLDSAISHARSATGKSGGVYAYVNNLGCDGGGRLVCYGRSFVIENGAGRLLAMATHSRETLFEEAEVNVAWIDPTTVQQYRAQLNIATRSWKVVGESGVLVFDAAGGEVASSPYSTADSDISRVGTITIEGFNILRQTPNHSEPLQLALALSPEEEIMRYCSLWLWDYLRRVVAAGSGIRGFIVPLSGGLDSAAVACIVFCLASLLHEAVYRRGDIAVARQLRPIFDTDSQRPDATPQDICGSLLRCVYLQSAFSGADSLDRARSLATLIGAQFECYNFGRLYEELVSSAPRAVPATAADPGGVTLQQQNVQARLRMVLTYYMSECNRLVLATGNVDEALVGYLTKYDCSSADLNPIGSISKTDLRRFVAFSAGIIGGGKDADAADATSPVLQRILDATPSAELTGEAQADEEDLGLSYDELSLFGRLRRGQYGTYGPYGMFAKLWEDRRAEYVREVFRRYEKAEDDDQQKSSSSSSIEPQLLATKVKRFFSLYARNRHKQTILTPALHTETYSPDDNRFDHRQFLFNTRWPWQFGQIDRLVQAILDGKEK